MEQQKLVDQDELPILEPLALNPNELSQALSDSHTGYQSNNTPFERKFTDDDVTPDKSQIPNSQSEPSNPSPSAPVPRPPSPAPTHNHPAPQPPLTPAPTITSLQISPNKKPIVHAYALPQIPPEPTDQLDPIIDATAHQTPPPIRMLPLYMPLDTP
jgi:hypothetical protein